MSDPTIWTIKMPDDTLSKWVKWEDYARLKAEVEVLDKIISRNTEYIQDQALEIIALKKELERLRASSFVTAVPSADYEQLKAENERLRKAGDELSIALAAFHLLHRGRIDTTTQPDIVAWHAAKGGKPSV